jgi:glutamyl-tRNA synthetase
VEHLNKAPAVFDYKKLEWFNGQYIRAMSDEELYDAVLPFLTGTGDAALAAQTSATAETADGAAPVAPKTGSAISGLSLESDGTPGAEGKTPDEVKDALMRLMPLIKERLHFLDESAEMVSFLFKEPAAPKAEDLIPKKLDAAKTKDVLAASLEFVKKAETLSHDEADALARKTAETLGVKLGDFMMPIRLAVTGSRISPPLIGSIAILGADKAMSRIQKALAAF